MCTSEDKKDFSFLCLNHASIYELGSLSLPRSFSAKYGDIFPERIYLKLPCGAIWRGTYIRSKNCIEGLETMFKYYRLKPHQVVLFHYNGGRIIDIEIFNTYAVEIEYIQRDGPYEKPIFTLNGGAWVNDVYYLDCHFEIDKLQSQFSYNALKNCTGVYDMVISKKHLKRSLFHKVLSSNACRKLRLDESMRWLEIGYMELMWKIKLKWINGTLFFYKGWYDFVKTGKLRFGDICVFQRTSHAQKFEVAVFDRRNVKKFNTKGLEQGKSIMKWLKVMNCDTIINGEMEIPKLFIDQYGDSMSENVHLLLGDGNVYCVRFCGINNVMYGMKNLFLKYNVVKDYVIFFDYVGRSHFYVSIYNQNCFDILDGLSDKTLLSDVLKRTPYPIVDLSDDSSNSDAEKKTTGIRDEVVEKEGDAEKFDMSLEEVKGVSAKNCETLLKKVQHNKSMDHEVHTVDDSGRLAIPSNQSGGSTRRSKRVKKQQATNGSVSTEKKCNTGVHVDIVEKCVGEVVKAALSAKDCETSQKKRSRDQEITTVDGTNGSTQGDVSSKRKRGKQIGTLPVQHQCANASGRQDNCVTPLVAKKDRIDNTDGPKLSSTTGDLPVKNFEQADKNGELGTPASVSIDNLENSQSLPFIKRSPLWKAIESMEIYKRMAQKPHFSPLVKCCKETREGLAIAHMVNFFNLSEITAKLQLSDPITLIESSLETLAELESDGFDVEKIRACLTQFLSKKQIGEELQKEYHDIENKISNCYDEKEKLDEEISQLNQKMKEITAKLGEAVSNKEMKERLISTLKSKQDVVSQNVQGLQLDFQNIAASLC